VKRKLFTLIIAIMLLMCSNTAYAVEGTSDRNTLSDDNILSLTHYDVETGMETKEVISVSELQTHNALLRSQIRDTLQGELTGYIPPLDTNSSTSGMSMPRTIFDGDSQSRVNVNNYPYSCVLYLRAGFDINDDGVCERWFGGTGFLVGYDTMVTAGNIFIQTIDGVRRMVDQCRIYVRQASTSYGSTYYLPKNWTYSTVYMDEVNDEHDWIVATLSSPLGLENGYFAVRNWNLSIAGVTATISGYPGSTSSKRYYQYQSSGPIRSYTTKRMSYLIDTEAGNSGSPIFISNNQVIGIHTGGGTQANWGMRIFEGLYAIIENRRLAGEQLYG